MEQGTCVHADHTINISSTSKQRSEYKNKLVPTESQRRLLSLQKYEKIQDRVSFFRTSLVAGVQNVNLAMFIMKAGL